MDADDAILRARVALTLGHDLIQLVLALLGALAVAAAVARFAQLSRRYASHSTRPIGHGRRLLIQISTSLSRRQITLRSRASPLQPRLMTCPLQRLPRVA